MMYVVKITTCKTVFVEADTEESAKLTACVRAKDADVDSAEAVVIDRYEDDWSVSV